MPSAIEQKNGIPTAVIKHGIAVSISLQSIYFTLLIMYTPTIISAGAVAAEGTIPAIGANRHASRNRRPVTTDARPVRAPADTPVLLSTKVVVVLVPRTEPATVAIASAVRAREALPCSILPFSSSILQPAAHPISVPHVSKMSQIAKVRIAVTSGIIPKPSRPSNDSFAKVGASVKPSKDRVTFVLVTPSGIPIRVVKMIE